MDPTTTIVGSLKKKKSKMKKKRLGSCFGPIVAECASRRADHGIVPFSPRGSDIAGKDPFHRRSLSGVVKAMLFGTSMAKKFRKAKQRGKIDQTESDSNSNSNPCSQSKSNPQKNPETSAIPLGASSSSSSSPSSSIRKTRSLSSLSASAIGFSTSSSSSLKSSSSSSSSTSQSQTLSREPSTKSRNCYGADVGLCLILISLLVLVLWGKICAILCTSSWLFFAPRLKLRFRPSNSVAMDVYSEADKKKVVLEGLLERNRLVRQQSKLC